MAFEKILQKLLDSVESAREAVFIDWEGEAVVSLPQSDEAKISAAHLGVILDQLRRANERVGYTDPHWVSLRLSNVTYLIQAVNSEYCITLTLEDAARCARAAFALRRAAEAVRDEM